MDKQNTSIIQWNCRGVKPNYEEIIKILTDKQKKNIEPLADRRQDIVLNRIRIGHTHLTHTHLLKGESTPRCTNCNQFLTVKHILIECKKYKKIRNNYYQAQNLNMLFQKVSTGQIMGYLKEIKYFQLL